MKGAPRILLAVAAVAFTAGILWFTHRTLPPRQATWEDVLTEAHQGGYRIIQTDELWQQYNRDPEAILLVDTRQEWEYRTGHIQGAVNFPMEPTWLSRWQKRGDLKRLLGSDKNRLIVFY